MARSSEAPEPSDPTAPLSQKQEDLLIELFVQLPVADRKKVIKLCRDLLKASKDHES